MDVLEKLGTRIRVLRKTRGLTQLQLAVECEISENYISLIEMGQRSPSIPVLNRIAQALGVSLQDLFAFSGNEKTGRYGEEALQELIIFLQDKDPEDVRFAAGIIKQIIGKLEK